MPFYPSFNEKSSNCEVLSIAIVPESRMHGLGQKLMYSVREEFQKRGHKYFQLSVRENMQDANVFYEKIGLKKIKTAKFLGDTINFWQGKC